MDPSQAMHAYENLSLFTMGLLLSLILIGVHLAMVLRPEHCKRFFIRFPRNQQLGQILIGVGLIWFWLLVAPKGDGLFNVLSMDLGEFDKLKPFLRLAVPVSIVLVAISIKEFLAVRALGLLGLMIAAPLLESAFLEMPVTRLLIPFYAYVVIIASLYCVGMPYLFRDAIDWIAASQKRWKWFSVAGLGYGILTFCCALLFWRGY